MRDVYDRHIVKDYCQKRDKIHLYKSKQILRWLLLSLPGCCLLKGIYTLYEIVETNIASVVT